MDSIQNGRKAGSRRQAGTIEIMVSRYSFREYSTEWPGEFAREAELLRGLLGDELLGVHHIGSTSVPGLAAKPVIDLLPVVRSVAWLDGDAGARMEEAGYRIWGEYGLAGRRFFTRDREGVRTHNVHIYETGNPDVERHLAFCVYLRAHPEVCAEYERLKREVYARHPADIEAYNDGKDAWIKRVEGPALEWYRAQR